MTRPAQRRELAEKAVATKGVSIALACRAFSVSETCFRYSPKRDDENEMIADLLVGLTNVHKTWGFGLCFLHLRNVKGHVGGLMPESAESYAKAVWSSFGPPVFTGEKDVRPPEG